MNMKYVSVFSYNLLFHSVEFWGSKKAKLSKTIQDQDLQLQDNTILVFEITIPIQQELSLDMSRDQDLSPENYSTDQ
jgi:hypothetical protein